MAGTTLDLKEILQPDNMAVQISENFRTWNNLRNPWLNGKRELRNYVFATDTRTTTNSQLPWKNSTTLPKLCQIRDNLHANYMSSLFPNQDWLSWEGEDSNGEDRKKREAIQFYMRNKVRRTQFETTVEQLVLDYIDYGNAFATTEWINESMEDETTGEIIQGYIGPKLVRVSPLDIVFNPIASDFTKAPKIIRTVKMFGELKRDIEDLPNDPDVRDLFNQALGKVATVRKRMTGMNETDIGKDDRFNIDGFGSMFEYYNSGYVELLTFYGDMYDVTADKFYKNHIITVVDRSTILSIRPNPNWFGNDGFHHVGWRSRQDNLYAMGPLDNLVGMQYRIDHLENLKADVFDQIAAPVLKVIGHVEDFEWKPYARIYCGDEGDVVPLPPDTTALNADTQIALLEQKMEEMAGAPREAMGFRTQGEKTAFEFQTLTTAANRIFQKKIGYFEATLLEPALNDMLELSRRNMQENDVVRVLDDESAAVLFKTVTREDLVAKGRLRPRGASTFARKATLVQNLTNFSNSAVAQDPAVNVHISGLRVAELMEELLDLDKFNLVQPNIRLEEQAETQRLMQSTQEVLQAEQATPAGLVEESMDVQ